MTYQEAAALYKAEKLNRAGRQLDLTIHDWPRVEQLPPDRAGTPPWWTPLLPTRKGAIST